MISFSFKSCMPCLLIFCAIHYQHDLNIQKNHSNRDKKCKYDCNFDISYNSKQ